MPIERPDPQARLATILAIVITGIWAISFFVSIFVREWQPPASVHALMLIVAGAVFGEGFIKSRKIEVGPPTPKEEPPAPAMEDS